MYKLSLSPFPSFVYSSWETSAYTVFILYVVYQIVFNVIETLHTSIASIDRSPKSPPSLSHAAAVFTPPTMWWCTCCQEPCLTLKFLTLYPKYINTAVLYLLINPPHKSLTKVGLTDTKPRNILNC